MTSWCWLCRWVERRGRWSNGRLHTLHTYMRACSVCSTPSSSCTCSTTHTNNPTLTELSVVVSLAIPSKLSCKVTEVGTQHDWPSTKQTNYTILTVLLLWWCLQVSHQSYLVMSLRFSVIMQWGNRPDLLQPHQQHLMGSTITGGDCR